MALSHSIAFATLADLYLDPSNPRLGLGQNKPLASQERILELMRGWNLEELAVSFLENKFWPQEAVIVVKEKLYGQAHVLVVVEGNRRIAALRYLKQALAGDFASSAWQTLTEGATPDRDLFSRIPYILADSRDDVTAYLGFRHVTGIKHWAPTQKAEFIAGLIDEGHISYDDIRKKIGMKIDTVRRNYIAYRILRQIGTLNIEVSESGVEKRFSVLFLSLREEGVRSFLGVDTGAEPSKAKVPVPQDKVDNLSDFAQWLFGSNDRRQLFSDSRYVGDFARVLSDSKAVDYLRSTPEPSFDLALQMVGVEDEEIENQLKEANNQMEMALSRVHLYRDSKAIEEVMMRLARNARELISKFPSVAKRIGLDVGQDNDA